MIEHIESSRLLLYGVESESYTHGLQENHMHGIHMMILRIQEWTRTLDEPLRMLRPARDFQEIIA